MSKNTDNPDIQEKKIIYDRCRQKIYRKYKTVKGHEEEFNEAVDSEIRLGRKRLRKEKEPVESINSVFEGMSDEVEGILREDRSILCPYCHKLLSACECPEKGINIIW